MAHRYEPRDAGPIPNDPCRRCGARSFTCRTCDRCASCHTDITPVVLTAVAVWLAVLWLWGVLR